MYMNTFYLLTLNNKYGLGDMNNVCFSLVEAANFLEDLKLRYEHFWIRIKTWFTNSNISILKI